MTNEIFQQFSKCARAGFLASKKPDIMDSNYLIRKKIEKEFTEIAFKIVDSYESCSGVEVKKSYEFKTTKGEVAIADIIVKTEEETTLIGLICSAEEPNWGDIQNLAYTYYVAKQTGFHFDKICLANIRKDYSLDNSQLTHELLRIKDYTKKVIRLQPRIESTLKRLKEKLRNNAMPANGIDYYCIKPCVCPFKNYCEKKEIQTENNIFELNDMNFHRKLQLYRQGYTDYTQLPEGTILSLKSQNQIDSVNYNKEIIVKEKLKEWIKIACAQKFIWFLEFETDTPIIPITNDTKPFTIYPFLYTMYYWDMNRDTQGSFQKIISPTINLTTEKDLALSFIQQISLNKNAPIVVSNAEKIKNCIMNLAVLFPEIKNELSKISKRLIDIRKIFIDHIYYAPSFKGSSYFKYIIPIMCPNFSYEGIKIKSGIQAQAEFKRLETENIQVRNQIEHNLIEYAKRDVLGLFKAFEFLRKKVEII